MRQYVSVPHWRAAAFSPTSPTHPQYCINYRNKVKRVCSLNSYKPLVSLWRERLRIERSYRLSDDTDGFEERCLQNHKCRNYAILLDSPSPNVPIYGRFLPKIAHRYTPIAHLFCRLVCRLLCRYIVYCLSVLIYKKTASMLIKQQELDFE